MKRFLIIPVILILCSTLFAQKEKEPVKVTDLLNISTISNVSLNKAGSQVVFTVTTSEPDSSKKFEYKYVSQIWLATTGDQPVVKQLTTIENSSQPVFSPDGKQIAFVRSVENKPQLFLLPLDGGEAVQLSHFKYGAGNPTWSPDGKKLLFSAAIPLLDLLNDSILNPDKTLPKWSLEKPGFENNEFLKTTKSKPDPDGTMEEIRAYLDKDVDDKKAKVLNKLNIQDETGVNPDLSFTHFFIIDVKADAEPIPVTKGFFQFNYAAFTPDGKQLLVGGDIDSTQHPDRSLEGQVYIMNTDGGSLRKILGDEGVNYNSPRISPSGKWLAFQYGNTSFVSVPALAVMPVNGTEKDKMDIPFDRNKGNITWGNDDKYIYFTSPSNGGVPLFRADIINKKVDRLTDLETGIGSFDLENNKLAFVKTQVTDPFELYVSDDLAKNQKEITHLNSEWLKNRQLSFPEKRTFVNDNKETIEYWIMKPTEYVFGKKYPLLLEIHGGPSAMWGPGENSMWHEFQYFCSKGYGIVYCNPRGSGGYGFDFLRSNINNWGEGPTSDVLTALDNTIKTEKWVDTSKLLITGGSYAGYLVAWIVGHDHRFKAACAQRGVYDLATFFGEGNAWRLIPNYFGGYPWESATQAILDRESPITYVKDITTPLIIFHGENDRRTGVIQSEMLYRSLKVLGRPVEYVRHPNATHEITRSGNNRQRIDQMLRTYEFFERWIK